MRMCDGTVVGAFIIVFVVCIFRHKPFEKSFKIAPRGWRSILHDDQAATCVTDEYGRGAGLNFALRDNLLDLIGDFICSFAARCDFKTFRVCVHHQRSGQPTFRDLRRNCESILPR